VRRTSTANEGDVPRTRPVRVTTVTAGCCARKSWIPIPDAKGWRPGEASFGVSRRILRGTWAGIVWRMREFPSRREVDPEEGSVGRSQRGAWTVDLRPPAKRAGQTEGAAHGENEENVPRGRSRLKRATHKTRTVQRRQSQAAPGLTTRTGNEGAHLRSCVSR